MSGWKRIAKKTTESDFYEIIGIGDLRIRLTAV